VSWLSDTTRALSAAVKLIMHDDRGLSEFNNSTTGFWRSFSAIIFIAPLYLFIANIDWAVGTEDAPKNTGQFLSMIRLGLQWAVWPLIMVFATRGLGLGHNFTRYVIVYNWSNVILITVLSLPALFFLTGILSLQSAALLTLLLQLGAFYIEWYLARMSLETTGLIAGAIVLGNFVLSIGIIRIIG